MSKIVSVVIPTFNREQVLERAIKSVLDQSYQNIELIVIDDGSTDNTKDICSKFDLKYLYQKNKGVSSARNLGIQNSNGEFISFLDSDDEWHPTKLKKQIELMNLNPELNFIHTNEIWIRNNVRVNAHKKHKKGGGDQFLRSLEFCVISPSTVIVRKEIFETYGFFREDFPVCEDYDLWLKITSQEEVGFIEEELLYKHGGHSDQLSTKYFAMDYWRIKSLKFVLDQNNIDEFKKIELIRVLRAKCEILLKGYTKHNNLENHVEINTILREINDA